MKDERVSVKDQKSIKEIAKEKPWRSVLSSPFSAVL